VIAAAESPGRAARGGLFWTSACPVLSLRPFAVTRIWADSRASVERLGMIYVRQAPDPLLNEVVGIERLHLFSQTELTARPPQLLLKRPLLQMARQRPHLQYKMQAIPLHYSALS
jgi:hypothetical protein